MQRVLAAILLVLSAIALQRAATSDWGRTTTGDGVVTISPIGLSRLASSSAATRVDCRWWPEWDTKGLCAVQKGGDQAFGRLRAGYPLVQLALWLSVAGLFLVALRIPRARGPRIIVCWGAALLAVVAIVMVTQSATAALDTLATRTIDFGGSGIALAWGAAAAAFIAGILEWSGSRRPPR